MIITKQIEVTDYGTAITEDLAKIGRLKKIFVESIGQPVLLTIIINGYQELVSDLPVSSLTGFNLPNQVDVNSIRIIAKKFSPSDTSDLIISFDVC